MNLRSRLIEMIRREVEHHVAGHPAGICFKANSLTDKKVINELYRASSAGLPIDLLIRGVCCLRPGLKNQSETIRVGSVVGRFLEHSRIFRFLNGGQEEIYLSSADPMSRNLDNRLEVMFPIDAPALKNRIRREGIELPFTDNVKLRWLTENGTYVRANHADTAVDSQSLLMTKDPQS
jgi:polyphosphate kinase